MTVERDTQKFPECGFYIDDVVQSHPLFVVSFKLNGEFITMNVAAHDLLQAVVTAHTILQGVDAWRGGRLSKVFRSMDTEKVWIAPETWPLDNNGDPL